ncbi:MAG: tRNA threonylcarbamoyladenosine dehydratase [Zoogloeaceae bacterium]|jgi:tRNA A37 threonylcarbamoyladenosine dehydratase|nr:tRNA threonylcarbamoyladenosine dehydratase [Zoogloeaceae bacterium]
MQVSRRFGGIARLYGETALARLSTAHLCVIGIGGVGSWAAEALARSGVGRLTLIDLDHIAESNLNRQIHALEETLGQAKALAMRARIAGINPDCEAVTIEEFVTPENVSALLPVCDCVVDAIDQVLPKAALIAYCRRQNIPVVTTGAAGGKRDPAQMRVDDLSRTTQDPLAARLRSVLRRDYGFPRDPKKKFGLSCVYSLEPVQRPDACATAPAGLSCAGYGSSVCVTASFGFAAASRALAAILGE